MKEHKVGKNDGGGMEEACDRVRGVCGHGGEDDEGAMAAGAVYEGWIRGGRKRKGGL
jgi:hypothetical protein